MALVALATVATSFVLLIPNLATPTFPILGVNGVGGLVLGLTYPIVGWLIASRRPENPIGWIFLVVGLSQSADALSGEYSWYGLMTDPGSLPLSDVASWVAVWAWVPGFTLLFLLVLLFPDGRLPSRRWRPVVWVAAAGSVLALVPWAAASWAYRGVAILTATDLPADDAVAMANTVQGVGVVLILLVGLAAVLSIVVRFRRSTGIERQQLKWFTSAAVMELAFFVVALWITIPPPFDALLVIIVVPLVPLATAIAILRYRLYDLDRLVSRTIAYAAVTGGLIVVYLAVNLGLTAVLQSYTSGNSVAVAASTLVVAALFAPLRRRIQHLVDRRFDRARYDAERTTAAFSERLRNEVDLAAVAADLSATVQAAIAPMSVDLWLREARS
jgi:hypothetical protein